MRGCYRREKHILWNLQCPYDCYYNQNGWELKDLLNCALNEWPLSTWNRNLPIQQEYPAGLNTLKFDSTGHNLDRLLLGKVITQSITWWHQSTEKAVQILRLQKTFSGLNVQMTSIYSQCIQSLILKYEHYLCCSQVRFPQSGNSHIYDIKLLLNVQPGITEEGIMRTCQISTILNNFR